jgi:hypothetical protein
LTFFIASIFFIAGGASAKGSGLRLELSAVYAQHTFSGFAGADFATLTSPGYDISINYKTKDNIYVLGYFVTPQIQFKDVRWSDQTLGNYTLEYNTPYVGFAPSASSKYFSFEFQLGMESISISGSPDVNYKDTPSLLMGVKFGTNLKAPWRWAKNWIFPVSGRMWFTQKRDLEFIDKPSENSSISAGTNFDFLVGVAFNGF